MGFRGLVLLAGVLGLLSGCGLIKDAKEMKSTLEEVNRKGDHVSKRTDDLERELRVKESAAEFNKYADRVFGENGAGVESPESQRTSPDTEMLLNADMAIHALMFQFWKGDFNEGGQDSLDMDFEKSVLMFFTRIRKYVARDNDLNIPASQLFTPDRGYKGLASFAARLDEMEPNYKKTLETKGLPTNLSFYELVMQALRDRDQVRQGGLLPKAKTRVLEWKREALFTIQLRHNYLPMMVITRITDFGDRDTAGRASMLVLGNKVNLNDSDPTKSISNALLAECTLWLNKALETRSRLREMGIEPKFNNMFGKLLKSVDFGQADILARRYRSSGDAGRDQLIFDFAEAYQKVVGEMPSNVILPNQLRSESDPAVEPGA